MLFRSLVTKREISPGGFFTNHPEIYSVIRNVCEVRECPGNFTGNPKIAGGREWQDDSQANSCRTSGANPNRVARKIRPGYRAIRASDKLRNYVARQESTEQCLATVQSCPLGRNARRASVIKSAVRLNLLTGNEDGR